MNKVNLDTNLNWRSQAHLDIPLAKARGGYADKFPDRCWKWLLQTKLDGFRESLQIGTNTNWLVGRNKKDKLKGVDAAGDYMVHAFDSWLHKMTHETLAGTMFDGELVWPGHGSAEISSCIAQGRTDELKYGVFDVLFHKSEDYRDEPYEVRFALATELVNFCHLLGYHNVFLVPTFYDMTPEKAEEHFKKGIEGFVAKSPSFRYYDGAPNCMFKLKASITTDFFVTGYTEGKTAGSPKNGIKPVPSGYLSTFTVGMLDDNGKVVNVGTVGNSGPKNHEVSGIPVSEAHKYLGKVIEADVSGYDGSRFRWARFRKFREDKTSKDCLLSEQIGSPE